MSEQGWGEESRRVGDVAKALAQEFTGPIVEADGRVYHDGGMSPAQELGATVATAVEYLRLLEGRLDDTKAAQAIGMTLASDADMFVSLAKFRAARLLWRQAASSCGLPQVRLKLHAESSFRMMTPARTSRKSPAQRCCRLRCRPWRSGQHLRPALLAGAGPARRIRAADGAKCAKHSH